MRNLNSRTAIDNRIGIRKSMDNPSYLFVYGTLRKQANHPTHDRLAREAVLLGPGTFQGKLYDLGRYPGAVASRDGADLVIGEIYRLEREESVLEALDRYEGPKFCRRRVRIRRPAGEIISCWIYLCAAPVTGHKLIPSGDYIKYRRLG